MSSRRWGRRPRRRMQEVTAVAARTATVPAAGPTPPGPTTQIAREPVGMVRSVRRPPRRQHRRPPRRQHRPPPRLQHRRRPRSQPLCLHRGSDLILRSICCPSDLRGGRDRWSPVATARDTTHAIPVRTTTTVVGVLVIQAVGGVVGIAVIGAGTIGWSVRTRIFPSHDRGRNPSLTESRSLSTRTMWDHTYRPIFRPPVDQRNQPSISAASRSTEEVNGHEQHD